MANTKISGLPSAASLTGVELLPAVQSGSTTQATVNQVKTYVNTTPAITGGSINSTPIGATAPSTGAFTSLSASGLAVTAVTGVASALITATTGTASAYIVYTNTGGSYYIGIENSTGGSFSSTPYALVQYAPVGRTIQTNINSNIITSVSSSGLAVTGNISSTGRTLVGTTTDDGVNALQVNGSIKGGSIITSSSPSIAVDAWFCLSSAGARRFEWHKAATSEDMVAYKLTGAAGNESAVEVMRVSNSTGLTTIGAGLAVTGNISSTGTITPQQATTAYAPAYVKGAIYFDTTLNKLRVGGATAWETITSV